MEEKETKKGKIFYKKWWFWIIICLILFIIIILLLLSKNKSNGIGTAGISIDEFKKIENGMDQFEVNSIIDELDEWNNDETYEKACQEISSEEKDSVYTYVYKYVGEKGGYALITYEVDYSDGAYGLKYPEVIKKEQVNLK